MPEAQSASELADELGKLDIKTTDTNEVYARVTDIRGRGDSIYVDCELVTGDTFTQQFDKPQPWDTRFAFVRIVEEYGYDASSFDNLVGEEVAAIKTGADYTDSGWELKDPVEIDEETIHNVRRWVARLFAATGYGAATYIAQQSYAGGYSFVNTILAVVLVSLFAYVFASKLVK